MVRECPECSSDMSYSSEVHVYICDECDFEDDGDLVDSGDVEYVDHKCLACNSGQLSWSSEESLWICGSCGR